MDFLRNDGDGKSDRWVQLGSSRTPFKPHVSFTQGSRDRKRRDNFMGASAFPRGKAFRRAKLPVRNDC